jgi:hypothetical protein
VVTSPHAIRKARPDLPWTGPPPVVFSDATNVRPAWAIECIDSVARQTVHVRHVYSFNARMPGLDRIRAYVAAMPGGERVEIREIAVRSWFWDFKTVPFGDLDPETVVMQVGGDDWLLRDDAIEMVLAEHAGGALVTYGQFDPCPPSHWGWWRASCHTAEEVAASSYRSAPWRASHLATYRAGLLQRIRREDLHNAAGDWLWLVGDQAWMLPALEMAAERASFISTPIYAYRVNNPASVHNTPDRLAAQAAELAHLRSLPPYQRIEWPPR